MQKAAARDLQKSVRETQLDRERNNGSRRNKRRPDRLNEWGQNTQAVLFSSSSFVSMCRERKGWARWEKTHRQQGKTLNALTVLLTFTPQEKPASCLSFPQHLLHLTHGVINRIQRRRKEEKLLQAPLYDNRSARKADSTDFRKSCSVAWTLLSKTFHMPVTYPRATQSHRNY